MLNYQDEGLLYTVAEYLRKDVDGIAPVGRGAYWKAYFLSRLMAILCLPICIIPIVGPIVWIVINIRIMNENFIPVMKSRAVDLGEDDLRKIDEMCIFWWISFIILPIGLVFFAIHGLALGFMKRNYLVVKKIRRRGFSEEDINKAVNNADRGSALKVQSSIKRYDYNELRELKELYEGGVINKDEF